LTAPENSSILDEMQTISANRAKQSLGQVLDAAQREPVMIQRHNRPVAVVLSPYEYERLRGLNVKELAAFCDRIGRRAAERGLTEEKLGEMLAEE
jgi:antitoxin Phd